MSATGNAWWGWVDVHWDTPVTLVYDERKVREWIRAIRDEDEAERVRRFLWRDCL